MGMHRFADRRPARARSFALGLILAVWGSEIPVHARVPAPSPETEVKATFVLRFAAFVEWPPPEPDQHFEICTIGRSPVVRALERNAGGVRIRSRPVQIRRARDAGELSSCRVVFISKTDHARLRRVLDHLSNRPVLTVSDTPGFARAGTMFNFYRHGKFVRFELNLNSVRKVGLRVPARLSRMARIVATN